MKRVSLADVARAAGVGMATASRALSGREDVGEATRARIQEVASSMGYQPHRGAQALRTGRFGVIAISLPLAAPESAELLRGAATAAADRGYQLLVDAADAPGASAERFASMAVDGVVFVAPLTPGTGVLAVPLETGQDETGGEPARRAAAAVEQLLALLERQPARN